MSGVMKKTVARSQRASGGKNVANARAVRNGAAALPVVGLGKRQRSDFSNDKAYESYRKEKKEKKAKKKAKKEKKKSSWWDTILDVGMKILPHILPFFMSKTPDKPMTVSVHSKNRVGEAPVGAATPTAFRASSEPVIDRRGDHVRLEHTAVLPQPIKKYKLGTSTEAKRGDCIFTIDLNPQMESWLTQMCAYAQYDIEQVAFTFHPSLPTIQSGQVMAFFEVDPDTRIMLNQGDATMKQASALTSTVITDLWTPHSFVYSFHDRQWLWTSQSGSEKRLQSQGRFSIVATRTMDDDLPEELGSISISYQVRAKTPLLIPRPELGLSASFTTVPTSTTVYIFGTEKNVSANGEIYSPGDSSMPFMIVPQSLPFIYDVVRVGNVAGSCFRLPRGVYMAFATLSGPTNTSISVVMTVEGNYKLMTVNNVYFDYMANSETTIAHRACVFYSSGMESASDFHVGQTGMTGLTSAFLTFISLGGTYPTSDAISNTITALTSRIDLMQPRRGTFVDQVEGKIRRKRMILSEAGDPIYYINNMDDKNPLKVAVGDIMVYQTSEFLECWQLTGANVLTYAGDRLGMQYNKDPSVLPANKTMSMSQFRDLLPSKFDVQYDQTQESKMKEFRMAFSRDPSVAASATADLLAPMRLQEWLKGFTVLSAVLAPCSQKTSSLSSATSTKSQH